MQHSEFKWCNNYSVDATVICFGAILKLHFDCEPFI